MNGRGSGVHVGGTSIIMVFTLLFFAMFASLSLSSAHVDLRHSQRARDHSVEYYQADAEAARQLSELTAEELGAQSGRYTFTVSVERLDTAENQVQQIDIAVRITADLYLVIESYRLVNIPAESAEEETPHFYDENDVLD